MKKKFVFLLCFSILIYSCYPYSSFTRDELPVQKLLFEEEIIVKFIDGSVLISQPYHHIYTTEPGNFIYGIGKQKHRYINIEHKEFTGKLERASIDSLRIFGVGNKGDLICYLSDSTDIYFWNEDYVIVTPDQSPGLWCAGVVTYNQGDSTFSGRVLDKNIKSVEMKKFSAELTIISILLSAGVVFLIIGLIIASSLKPIGDLKF